jgi:septal ring factor EnvC (AmiA/AmiB activator)
VTLVLAFAVTWLLVLVAGRVHRQTLYRIESQTYKLVSQGVTIMAVLDDLKTELSTINATTNDIATALTEANADIDEILTRLAQPGGLTEAEAQQLLTDLRGAKDTIATQASAAQAVAAKWPLPPA